jgi:Xaa-Pro aminopeptidase
MALDGAERADLARLRHERTNRVFEAMDRDEVDVLVLGREGNARYASGLQRLPVAVARPFIPSAVLVREARATHALSGWDFVTAPEISPEQQYPTHWDPAAVAKAIGRIDGVPGARRVALDSVSPQWRERLSSLCKAAGFVDAGPLMRAVRMVKTEDEVFCIRTAVAIAEAGLVAASAILGPGRRERELLGAFVERMSEFGLTVPASEGGFCTVETEWIANHGLRRITGDRTLREGDLVTLNGGVLFSGYEGRVGRTVGCGAQHRLSDKTLQTLTAQWAKLWGHLYSVLGPGATGADLCRAYRSSGSELPRFPIATSVGLGIEAPIAGSGLGDTFDEQWTLSPGMVLQVQGLVTIADNGYFGLETVLITDGGPEMLTTLRHGAEL